MGHWITEPFASDFTQRAAITCILLGILAPAVGTWIVLRRLAYLGDAMSHASVGGVAIAFAIGGTSSVLIGALGAGIVMALLIALLSANRRLGQDAVIGVIESAMFAVGILVITRIDSGRSLTHFLFGQLLTVQRGDVILNGALTVAGLIVLALLFDDLRMSTFDPNHAAQVGVRVQLVQTTLLILVATSVVVALRTVGSLMAIAMLVTPAATARLITRDVLRMTLVSVMLGVSTALVGFMLSYHLNASPGATISLTASAAFVVVYVVSLPKRMRHHSRFAT